jgi:hypothetical protein
MNKAVVGPFPAKIRSGNGVQKQAKKSDSDLRLQPFCWDLRGKRAKIGRVSVKVSVARLLRYNSKRTRPLLANGGKSSWFIVIT